MLDEELKIILDKNYKKYCCKDFIKTDPIQIPHRYTNNQDIEIAGFIACMLAFGSRKQFLPKIEFVMSKMQDAKLLPHHFVISDFDEGIFEGFVYRHFSKQNLIDYLNYIKFVYKNEGGFYPVILQEYKKTGDLKYSIKKLRDLFILSKPKTISSYNFFGNVQKDSACKKINMFFRWMVRKDEVDLGIWDEIDKKDLYIPLDTHVLKNANAFGLTDKKTTSFKNVNQITLALKKFDPVDPIKYDFSLFALTAIG